MIRCMGCMRMIGEDHITCPHCGFSKTAGQDDERYLEIGSVISGRYIVGKALGSGGFGITYIAWDSMLKKTVAIKEYFPSSSVVRVAGSNSLKVTDAKMLSRFESGKKKAIEESRCLARLDNVENVTDVFDCFEENNTAYIIMEYLEGKTLKELIVEDGKIPFNKAMKLILPVLDSLSKVHETGLIHRDISPDNIFLCNDSKIKILDFGSARYALSQAEKTYTIVLKNGFAPVEQYSVRSSQGPWTDVYAVAATLYMMITGIKPMDSIERVRNDNLKSPLQLGIDIPVHANIAIMDALCVDEKNRTRNIGSFKRGLMGLEARKGSFDEQNRYNNVQSRHAPQDKVQPYTPNNEVPQKEDFKKSALIVILALVVALAVILIIMLSVGVFEEKEITGVVQPTTRTTEEETEEDEEDIIYYEPDTTMETTVAETTTEEETTEEETTTEVVLNPSLILDSESIVVTYSDYSVNLEGVDLPSGWNSIECDVEDEEIARVDVLPIWQNKWRVVVTGLKVGKTTAHLYLKDNPEVSADLDIDIILTLSE